jgi:hypothetical protein
LDRGGFSPLPPQASPFRANAIFFENGETTALKAPPRKEQKMPDISLPLIAAWANAAFLGAAGLINWFDGQKIRALYRRWSIPARSYRTIGLLEIAAAMFLAVPHLRAWGIVLAGVILFGSAIMLLSRRRYGYAMAVVAMMVMLGAAVFAIPTNEPMLYASL